MEFARKPIRLHGFGTKDMHSQDGKGRSLPELERQDRMIAGPGGVPEVVHSGLLLHGRILAEYYISRPAPYAVACHLRDIYLSGGPRR
jgi:hypothetical protein